MPAVNYDLMLQEMLSKTAGKVNQVIYWGRPLDWQNQTLTPNPDAHLLHGVLQHQGRGPIVLDVPPGDASGSLNGNIVNVWQMPLEDAGLLGVDKGKGGKFLILPPGYADEPSRTATSRCSRTRSAATRCSARTSRATAMPMSQKSIAYGKRMKVYPLSQAANPPRDRLHRREGRRFRLAPSATTRASSSTSIASCRASPGCDRDRAMIDQLKSLGIEKGKPFNPDATRPRRC